MGEEADKKEPERKGDDWDGDKKLKYFAMGNAPESNSDK